MKALTETEIQKLVALGGKRWTKGDHDRIYFEAVALHELIDGDIDFHKSGNVSFVDVPGVEKAANARAILKTYIDAKTGEWAIRPDHEVTRGYLAALEAAAVKWEDAPVAEETEAQAPAAEAVVVTPGIPTTATEAEIEAWVNPSAWDDEDEARRVIETIMTEGGDLEEDWARIAGLGSEAEAVAREADTADPVRAIRMHAREVARLEALLSEAVACRNAAIREARAEGATQVELAELAGVSQPMVVKILRG